MKLLLHIGAPKAGSTALQRSLAATRSELEANGFLYPSLFPEPAEKKEFSLLDNNHDALRIALLTLEGKQNNRFFTFHKILRDADRQDWAKRRLAVLKETVKSSTAHTCILSSEHFLGFANRSGFPEFCDLLRSLFDSITAIFYFRPYHQGYCSSIQQALKGGEVISTLQLPQDFGRFPNRRDEGKSPLTALNQYVEKFGREQVKILHFASDALINGDVVEDFCQRFVYPQCDPAFRVPTRWDNASISAPAAILISMVKNLSPIRGTETPGQPPLLPLDIANFVVDQMLRSRPSAKTPKLAEPPEWRVLIAHKNRDRYQWLEEVAGENFNGEVVDPNLLRSPCPPEVTREALSQWLATHLTPAGLDHLLNDCLTLNVSPAELNALFESPFDFQKLEDLLYQKLSSPAWQRSFLIDNYRRRIFGRLSKLRRIFD